MLGFMTSGGPEHLCKLSMSIIWFLGDFDRPLPVNDDVVRKIMEFLTFLHLKGQ